MTVQTHLARVSPVLLALAAMACVETPQPCSVTANDDGSITVSCPDGTSETVYNGADGEAGEDGQTAFVSLTDLEPGDENCEHGGVAITYGMSGDDPEDLETVYLCNNADGEDGRGPILDVRILEEGDEHCPGGGVAVTYGYEGDDPEDLETVYVCNGVDGVDGVDGLDAILTVSEASEEDCPRGGLEITFGYDEDDLTTVTVCNGRDGEDGRSAVFEIDEIGEDDERCPEGKGGVEVFYGHEGDDTSMMDSFILCNGADGRDGIDGVDGLDAILRVSEASEEDCPDGGLEISYGFDEDDLTTVFVCDGADGTDGTDGRRATFMVDEIGEEDVRCPEGKGGVEVFYGLEGDDTSLMESFIVCNGADGIDGIDGIDGLDAIVRVSSASPSDCPDGGLAISYGYDEDDLTTVFVCDGADGSDGTDGRPATFFVDEISESDTRCPEGKGGVEVFYGLEGDDTSLMESFIICNGADGIDGIDGIDGVDGLDAILRVTEASLSDCPDGGLAISYGYDDDDLTTVFVCNGSHGSDGSDGADGSDGSDGSDGADGRSAAFEVVEIGEDDERCPLGAGGVEVFYGLEGDSISDMDSFIICNGSGDGPWGDRDALARRVDGTWIDVSFQPCGSGTSSCTAANARAACSAVGARVISHASDGSSTVYSLGASSSCNFSISYFESLRSMPSGSCLVGVSNLDWSSCCGLTRWHGNTVSIGAPGTIWGFVTSSNSGYVSSYPNVSGTRWGCTSLTTPASTLGGCTTHYVACTRE